MQYGKLARGIWKDLPLKTVVTNYFCSANSHNTV